MVSGTLYKKINNSRSSIDEPLSESSVDQSRCRNPWSVHYLFWINSGLLVLNLTAALFLLKGNYIGFGNLDYWEYAPLQNVISYDREYFDLQLGQSSAYTEDSGSEVDEKWKDITALPGRVGTIRVQKSELDRMNLSTIQLADGSYVATLDVFHQLHCLDRLRKALNNGTAMTSEMAIHIDHCIDSLRMNLQCHADTSLLTYKWVKDYGRPWPDFRSYHVCRNFEAIRTWAAERFFDGHEPGLVVHPQLGATNWSEHQTSGLPPQPIQWWDEGKE